MRIFYSTNKLEKTLTDLRMLKKFYSNDYSRLRNRLSELEAAGSLAEIPETPPPRRHKLTGNYAGNWGIDYSANDRIVLRPVGTFEVDNLESITEIEIIALGDYH